MNKMLKGLLAAALAVSSAQVSAHTNKTFLTPRPHGVNLPMEYTTFCELVGRKSEDNFGGSFQVTGFYQASTNDDDIAKYFLVNNKSTIALPQLAATNATSTAVDLDLGYLIHDHANGGTTRSATIGLSPEQTAWGIRLDYHQDLCKILKGLYLHASLPIVHVENDPKVIVKSTGSSSTFVDGTVAPAGTTPSVQTVLQQFLSGNFENTATAGNQQAKLVNAKIAGKQSETGVADIDLALGYRFLDDCNYSAAIALAITIPTGNEADGKYLFQPLVGNGKHFGLGGDLFGQACVWGDMDHNIKINLKMKYRYLFENSEKRTLGIKGRNWGQYLLLGQTSVTANLQLIPAANVTTLNVDVTAGSQFDGILGLAYNNCGFSLDVGYNMYFREEESIKLKDDFKPGVYAIAARNFATTVAFDAGTNAAVDNGFTAGAVNKDTLDLKAAETPSQFTHSVYAALGYLFRECDNPFMLAVGGKYEIPSKNSALEQWSVWVKAGIGF